MNDNKCIFNAASTSANDFTEYMGQSAEYNQNMGTAADFNREMWNQAGVIQQKQKKKSLEEMMGDKEFNAGEEKKQTI